jgi:hypothetical protein
MTRRIRAMVFFGVTVAAAFLAWLLWQSPPADTPTMVENAERQTTATAEPHAINARHDSSPSSDRIVRARRISPTERAELHRLLLAAHSRRTHDPEVASSGSLPSNSRTGSSADDEAEAVGDDEMNEWNQILMQRLDEDLAPLTEECFQAALERSPGLVQFVELELSVLVDEEHAALIETVDLGPRNQADDTEFIECVRESMLSTALPPPPFSGRKQIIVSQAFGDE